MANDMLLKNAQCIDHTGKLSEPLYIGIVNGRISWIAENEELFQEPVDTLDCSDLIVTPGLVNLHTHSPMSLFRGMAEDVQIDDWFNREIWPLEKNMDESQAFAGALASCYEMINAGVTAFADHYLFPESIIFAILESGVRGDLAPTLFGVSDTFQDDLRTSIRLMDKYQHKNPCFSMRFGPHSPYTCQPHQLKEIIQAAKSFNTGIHIHLSETKQQVKNSLNTYGKTPFQILDEAGGFSVPAILAHGLWIQETDCPYLSDDSHMAVSPKTYLKLAMGEGKLWDLADQLPLAIGTDGAGSSNSANPLEQIRLFGLLGKHIRRDATAFPLESLWQMLMRGHAALPFNTGRIEVGYEADLVFWDLNRLEIQPNHNPLASILYSCDTSHVKHVLVRGSYVKRDGKVLMDKEKVTHLFRKAYGILLERGKGESHILF